MKTFYFICIYYNDQSNIYNQWTNFMFPRLIQRKIKFEIFGIKQPTFPYSKGILYNFVVQKYMSEITHQNDIELVFTCAKCIPNEQMFDELLKDSQFPINLEYNNNKRDNPSIDTIGSLKISLTTFKDIWFPNHLIEFSPYLTDHLMFQRFKENNIEYNVPAPEALFDQHKPQLQTAQILQIVKGSPEIKASSNVHEYILDFDVEKIFYPGMMMNKFILSSFDYSLLISQTLFRNLLFDAITSETIVGNSNITWSIHGSKHESNTKQDLQTGLISNSALKHYYDVYLGKENTSIKESLSWTFPALYLSPFWSRYFEREDMLSYLPMVPGISLDINLTYFARYFSLQMQSIQYVRCMHLIPLIPMHIKNKKVSNDNTRIKNSFKQIFHDLTKAKLTFEHYIIHDLSKDNKKLKDEIDLPQSEGCFDFRDYGNLSKIQKNGKIDFLYNRCKSTWLNDNGFTHKQSEGIRNDYESLFISMVIAFSCLNINGTFISTFINHRLSIDYSMILQKYFDSIRFMKLPTSFKYQPHSYWIICTGFKGINKNELNVLQKLWDSGNYINTRFDFNTNFVAEFKLFNAFKWNVQFMHNHKYSIVTQLDYLMKDLSDAKKIKIKKAIRKEQIRYAYNFCKMFRIPINPDARKHLNGSKSHKSSSSSSKVSVNTNSVVSG